MIPKDFEQGSYCSQETQHGSIFPITMVHYGSETCDKILGCLWTGWCCSEEHFECDPPSNDRSWHAAPRSPYKLVQHRRSVSSLHFCRTADRPSIRLTIIDPFCRKFRSYSAASCPKWRVTDWKLIRIISNRIGDTSCNETWKNLLLSGRQQLQHHCVWQLNIVISDFLIFIFFCYKQLSCLVNCN